MLLGPGRLLGIKGGGAGASAVAGLFAMLQGRPISAVPAPHAYTAFALRDNAGQKTYVKAVQTVNA